ncbi:MAG: DNA polymerase/3'-5' exonuclease PolX, partial [Endomicrobiales bacterium]
MKNKELAKIFLEISELLSLKNESLFRIKAYERASQAIESLPEPIEEVVEKGGLRKIRGIGTSIADKIKEYLEKGKVSYLEELRRDFPRGLLDIMTVPGMGPRKAQHLYNELHVTNISELEKAARQGKIRELRGFGKKTEENILKGIALKVRSKGRILLLEAMLISREIISALRASKSIRQISPAGSLRRYRETVGDVDILCTVDKGRETQVIEQFTQLPLVRRVLAAGSTKATVITTSDVQVDVRVLDQSSYGAGLLYFTGSKEHNIVLRGMAREKGLTISEYGVFRIGKKERPIAGKTEEEVYAMLGLPYIPAPLRENRGEIEAAREGTLPKLVQRKDIRGDIHVHSRYSDGSNTLEEMAQKARSMGYEWIVSTDHSQSLKIAHGLSVATLKEKLAEIRRFNRKSKDLQILCGVELDIMPDGSLDYPETILKELDFVLASVHSAFKQPEKQITSRIVRALQNPLVTCIGHPTGRLLNKREPYAVNVEKVL